MEYEESLSNRGQIGEEPDLTEGVHIRQEDRGVMMYAVFDGEEQVSEEFGPLNYSECVSFAEGYSEAKDEYC